MTISGLSLRWDTRAQSVQVGAILLFGIAIIAFSSYQATVVPDQNREVEFEHYQEVRNEMTNVRSAIIQAKSTGNPQSTTVTLGTGYPNRIAALNPPPATGTLYTGEPGNISIENRTTGERIDLSKEIPGIVNDSDTQTRFVEYDPSYNEFNGAPIRYENTILYLDYREEPGDGDLVLQSDRQNLIDDDTVTLLPVQGEYRESGVEAVAFEPEPGILQREEFEDVNVTLPTKLDEETWEELLVGELDEDAVHVDEAEGELTLVLEGVYEIEYAPIGVDGAPDSGERGDSTGDINPAAPGDIALVGIDRRQNDDEWVLRFRNSADANNFSEGRVNFYPGSASVLERIEDENATRDVSWNVGDDFRTIDPDIYVAGDDAVTEVTLGFDQVSGNDEWFVVTFLLETGQEATYFVAEGGVDGEDDGAEDGSGQLLELVGLDKAEGNQLTFDVNNTGDDDVTIEEFAVDATDIATVTEIDNGDSDELTIEGDVQAGFANRKQAFDTDGTRYDLEKHSNNDGQYGIVGANAEDVTVDVRGFGSLPELQEADSAESADVVVTLIQSDGGENEFYFAET